MTKVKKSKKGENRQDNKNAEQAEQEGRLRRALADYQNLERRVEEERKSLLKLSALLLIEKFLPVLDNLESAQAHLQDEGLEIVIKQFKDILVAEGVEEIEAIGSEFNPNFHEAIETEQGEKDNMVSKVVNIGYKIEDKVIRPAKVVVSRKEELNT
jgi:molecular chaperone GrpE